MDRLGARPSRQPQRAAHRGARRGLGPRLVARRQPHRLSDRSPGAEGPSISSAMRITSPSIRRRMGELGRPTWSADSNSIAVGCALSVLEPLPRGAQPAAARTRRAPPAPPRRPLYPEHSAGNRQDTGPVWSPDGFRMAFVSEGALWVVPVDERGGATGPGADRRQRSAGVAELGRRFETHRLPDAARTSKDRRRRQPAGSRFRST